MTFAAVTMVYNEPNFLPIWCAHYSRQLGAENCYIIDHGGDDGSTRGLDGFNVVRIPRSPLDEEKRARFISRFASNLLEWHDGVIHTDVDEIAVPDPTLYTGLSDLMARNRHSVVNAIGWEIFHNPAEEPPIDLTAPILGQRSWVKFASSMCKPLLIRGPVQWVPGFHAADAPIHFDDLYLFHLRYFDRDLGLARLAKTRAMAWANLEASSHQRLPDDTFRLWIEQAAAIPRVTGAPWRRDAEPVSGYLRRVLASETDFRTHPYNLDLHITGHEMVEIPAPFRACF